MKKASILIFLFFFITISISTTSAETKPIKDWTLAVFINADNNLDRYGMEDQKEMSKVGSNQHMNIVVLIDRAKDPAQINYIEKDNIKTIKNLGEIDMGDYKEFVKFAKFIKENYPAKHYSFTFWNHGSGWRYKNENVTFKGISYDDTSSNYISTNQLNTALNETNKILGKKIDVLCFDACLMQMLEVAYACKDYALYMVGSEEIEPGSGSPYDSILSSLNGKTTPEEFAINWAKAYITSYNNGSQGSKSTTQSVIDLSKIDKLNDRISGVAKAIMSGKYGLALRRVALRAQKYHFNENKDLYDLLEKFKRANPQDKVLLESLNNAQKAVKEAVIYNGYLGSSLKDSNGIAIYFPTSYVLNDIYKNLDFSKKSMWDDMILDLAKKVQIEQLGNCIKNGNLSVLKHLVEKARENPKDPINRAILSELNYLNSSENAIPAEIKEEFNQMLSELISILKQA